MSKNEEYKEHVLKAAERDIIPDESGFYIFWPTGERGGLTAPSLRVIADRLDEINKPWEEEVHKYFEQNKKR